MTILRGQPGISVPEVAELLGISVRTVGNDLNSLAKLRQITRVTDINLSPAWVKKLEQAGVLFNLCIEKVKLA